VLVGGGSFCLEQYGSNSNCNNLNCYFVNLYAGFIWLALRPCEPAPSSSIRSPLKGELKMNTYTPMLKHTPKQIPWFWVREAADGWNSCMNSPARGPYNLQPSNRLSATVPHSRWFSCTRGSEGCICKLISECTIVSYALGVPYINKFNSNCVTLSIHY
jgi:hypothetical protein